MKNKPNSYGVIIYDKPKSNKYRNEPIVVDGIKFDSRKEANRYYELKLLERTGAIKDLQRQVVYTLIEKSRHGRAVTYKADFVYWDNEKEILVIEDVKSPATVTPVYKLKRRMMIEKGFEITEVL